MPPTSPQLDPTWLSAITPVVLVGGQSTRFDNDKLRKKLDDNTLLVQRPIQALRSVFGPRVAAVGACHPDVRACFDTEILDPYPGLGPMGGVLAALEHAPGAVLVLAGDLDAMTGDCVRQIAHRAQLDEEVECVLAHTDRDHPTIALYRQSLREPMRENVASAELSMHMFLRTRTVRRVEIDPGCAHNVNKPGDLPSAP